MLAFHKLFMILQDTGSSNDSEGLNGRLSVVLQALGLLEDEGIMCRRCDINLGYEVLYKPILDGLCSRC